MVTPDDLHGLHIEPSQSAIRIDHNHVTYNGHESLSHKRIIIVTGGSVGSVTAISAEIREIADMLDERNWLT